MNVQKQETEYIQKLDAAREELIKLKLLTEGVSSGIARMIYEDGLIIDYANRGLYEIIKSTPEEFYKKYQNRYDVIILPEDWTELRTVIDNAVRKDIRFETEYRVRNSEGEIVWRLMNATPMIEDGRVVLQCSISDITKIKEMEMHLDSLVENIPGGIFRIFYNGSVKRFEYASDGFTDMIGYTVEECQEINDQMLLGNDDVLKEDVSFLNSSVEKAYLEGKGECGEYLVQCKNGKKRWVELRSSVVRRTEEGVLIQYVVLDIQERKLIEEKLRRERIRLNVVAGLSTDSIFEYNVDLDIMRYYNQNQQLIESEEQTPLIKNYFENIANGSMTSMPVHKNDTEALLELCRQLRSKEENIYCEMRKQYGQGKYGWIAVEGRRYHEEGYGTIVIGKISNIDERVQRERLLKQKSERDSLTGLYNNRMIREIILEKLKKAEENEGHESGYLLIADVDNFKKVNDTMGHLFGDAVLCTFADSLSETFEEAVIGRIGGDEFLLYIEHASAGDIYRKTEEINKNLARIYSEGMNQLKISATFGFAKCKKGLSYDEIAVRADGALYFLKKNLKGGAMEYREGMKKGGYRIGEEKEPEFVPEAKIVNENDLLSFAREIFEHVRDTKGAIRILSDRISRFFEIQDILLILKEDKDVMRRLFHWGEQDFQQFYNSKFEYRKEPDWMTLLYSGPQEYVVLKEHNIVGRNLDRAKSILSIKVKAAKQEGYFLFVDKKNEREWKEESAVLIKLANIVFIRFMEMEQKRRTEEYNAYMNSHDKTTGLPNYSYFLSYCSKHLKNHPDKKYALVYSDFTNFQYLNELYGYTTGDQVLKRYAEKIQEGPGIQYARITGDKFLSFHEIRDMEELKQGFLRYINQFESEINERYPLCKLSVTGGIAEIDPSLENFAMNVDNANVARKSAKRELYVQVLVYTQELRERFQKEMEIISNMKEALENGEFVMYLQPKVNMENGRVIGAEALVRWIRSNGQMIRPDQFIPLFEKNNFITQMDYEIFRQVLEFQNRMKAEKRPVIPISVNFSRRHQDNPDDIRKLDELILQYQSRPEVIEIEITESAFMEDIEPLLKSVEELQNRKIAVSIDDFGSGYSSLNVLSKFRADIVKLDRQFLLDIEKERGSFATEFLTLLIRMIKQLGFTVVAEGVETREQIEVLKKAGCRFAQGYYFAKPMTADEFIVFMEEHGVEQVQKHSRLAEESCAREQEQHS